MKIAAIGRQQRRDEIAGYMRELAEIGHIIQARWLDDTWAQFDAPMDGQQQSINLIEDVLNSDFIVIFTEEDFAFDEDGYMVADDSRHVLYGGLVFFNILLGNWAQRLRVPEQVLWMNGLTPKRIMLVGPRESIHYQLPMAEDFASWADAKEAIGPADVAPTPVIVDPVGRPIDSARVPQLVAPDGSALRSS